MLSQQVSGEMDYSKQFSELTSIIAGLIRLIESNAGEPAGNMEMNIDAESLVIKAMTSALSAIKIYKEGFIINISGTLHNGCDFASVQILARSCMESYLMLYWLFVDQCSDDERMLRFLIWKATGLFWQTNIPNISDESQGILRRSEPERIRFIDLINSNETFNRYDEKKKKKIISSIKMGKSCRPKWSDLFNDAKLSQKMYKCYSFFCDYSHSGGLAAMQIKTADNLGVQRNMCHLPLNIFALFLAMCARDYAILFPRAEQWLSTNPETKTLVDKLCWIAHSLT